MSIISKPVTKEYEEGWDKIFGKKEQSKLCYAYDEELDICLLYGTPCNADDTMKCYHTNREGIKNLK